MNVVKDKADNWDSHVASVVFGYRVNKQGSTKMSPFELMCGVKPRLPLDLKGDVAEIDPSESAVDQRMVDLGQRLVEKRALAQENIKEAQAHQKKNYDIKHAGPTYSVGQLVMKFNRRRDTRMGDKLATRFSGPFTVYEILG